MRWETARLFPAAVCAFAASAAAAGAATIAVPANGDLQAALDAAQDGDVITLAPGAVYVGAFVLPNKPGVTHPITIRSAAADADLPAAGVRMTPAYAANLPKIRSPFSTAALRTAAGAHHWTIQFVEFQANKAGYGDIIDLGMGDTTQTDLSQVPYALVLDRVYIHGDPVMGQKRGIGLHSGDTRIINSWVSDCKAVGQDAQAIAGANGPGPFWIENNYIEGAAENFLIGGDDPKIPNLIPTNITFRGNYLSKPVAWRGAIVPTPTGVAASGATGGGTLAAGSYSYVVVARLPAGQTTIASSAASAAAGVTLAAAGSVIVSWTAVTGATEYRVYGRAPGAPSQYWTTTATRFTDTGAAGTAGTPGSATRWTTKNVFELKSAQDVVVDGNVFEYAWVGDQPGFPIVFTPRNQGGTAPFTVVQRVTFTHNLVQHAAGGVNILGTDNVNPSQLTNHITIRDNVFDDIGSAWGSGSKMFQIGAGPDAVTIDHNTVFADNSSVVAPYGETTSGPIPITNFVYTNNMSAHNAYGFLGADSSVGLATITAYFPGSTIVRNILAGGSASKYPVDNFFPTVTDWHAAFVNYSGHDYHLLSTSSFAGAGTDGRDLGADIDAVNAAAALAKSGAGSGGTIVRPTAPEPPQNVRILKGM